MVKLHKRRQLDWMKLKESLQSLFDLSDLEMSRIESETSDLDDLARSEGWSEDDILEVKVRAYVEAKAEHENRN